MTLVSVFALQKMPTKDPEIEIEQQLVNNIKERCKSNGAHANIPKPSAGPQPLTPFAEPPANSEPPPPEPPANFEPPPEPSANSEPLADTYHSVDKGHSRSPSAAIGHSGMYGRIAEPQAAAEPPASYEPPPPEPPANSEPPPPEPPANSEPPPPEPPANFEPPPPEPSANTNHGGDKGHSREPSAVPEPPASNSTISRPREFHKMDCNDIVIGSVKGAM